MFDKLEEIEVRFDQLNQDLQDPELANEPQKYRELMKELTSLQEIVSVFREHRKAKQDLKANKELLRSESDEELRLLAKEESSQLTQAIEDLEGRLKHLLLPKDPNDERNVILEIRAGAGGDEASLFTEELFSAYVHYAAQKNWRVETLSVSPGNAGGYKEVIANIHGQNVYSRLKFESGVHRVQRVPKTETQGRVHTSTVTVAVLPEVDEVEVDINPSDLRVDVFRSSGAGGQHVNTTDSAVRITHIPSGMVVSCQDEKSQHKNKAKAMKVLAARLKDLEKQKAEKEASKERLSQIGTGDRSERIRTYNFPQSRITDHRIGLTIHSLSDVMAGRFDDVVEPVLTYMQTEALKAQEAV